MLKSLPFDQRVNVFSQSKTSVVAEAPSIFEIQQKLTKNSSSTDIWPVLGPKSAPFEEKLIVEKQSNHTAVDDLSRLKIAALISILSQQIVNFASKEKNVCAQQSMNQTEFDFQFALAERNIYENELKNFRRISNKNLVFTFKKILSKLLERFYAANETRFDHEILNFVALLNHGGITTCAHFSFTDHQFMLAKQYVYSALYDGQLLQFDNNDTLLQVNSTQELKKKRKFENNDKQKKDFLPQKTQLQKVIDQIQQKTLQIFNKYKLLHELAQKCTGKHCYAEIKPIVLKLCNYSKKEEIWQALKSSPIEYDCAKNIDAAANLCSLAFASQSKETCTELQQCGFFDDLQVWARFIDLGCLENIQSDSIRRILLKKILQLKNYLTLLDCDDEKQTFQRALWLLSLTVVKPSVKQQINLTLSKKDCDDTLGRQLLKEIYQFFEKKSDKKKLQTQKKKIQLFLLRLKQFHLLQES